MKTYDGELKVVRQGSSIFIRLDGTAREKLGVREGDILRVHLESGE